MTDLRLAVRMLARQPGFAWTVVATLALGIGANTAIFSLVDRLLLRPLPYPESDRLAIVFESGFGGERNDVSPANWLDWLRMSQTFESFAAFGASQAVLTGEGEAEQWNAQRVSAEFFPLLRVKPLKGRIFTPEDDRPGAPPVVILSHRLWQGRFGGDGDIIGRVVELNATKCRIVGVMPAGFHFVSQDTDYWEPYALDRGRAWRGNAGRFMAVVGRIQQNVAPATAHSELKTIASRLAQAYPSFNKDTSVTIVPLREELTRQVRQSLLVLLAAVGVLALIACFNAANLLLVRSMHRYGEFAVRASLGAGRWPIVRLVLAESLVLALAAGAAGMLIAQWGVSGLLALAPRDLLRVEEVPLDGRVLLYTFALSVVCAAIFGLAPAIRATGASIHDAMRGGARATMAHGRLRSGFIVAQVAMTGMLLCGAGLLSRSLAALAGASTGMEAKDVLTMRVGLPGARYKPPERVEFFRQAVERMRALPGVRAAGAGGSIPVIGQAAGTVFHLLGEPELPLNERPLARVRVVTPGYFQSLGIPILGGRDFTDDDQREIGDPVFVVNEAFSKKYLAGRDPLSASISVLMSERNPHGRIVGVVGDVKEGSLRKGAEPTVFYNHRWLSYPGMTIFLRADQAASLGPAAAQVIRDLDPNQPVTRVRLLEEALGESIARERLNAVVTAAFGATALVLASMGLYGLLAFLVAQRTREIGLRMALGARVSQVVGMIMSHAARLFVLGCVLGLAGAAAVSRMLESLLYGVDSRDPVTGLLAFLVLAAACMAAALAPARRAARVDPAAALRQE